MIDIAKLRKDIEGTSEDARFLAFMALYDSKTEEAEHEIERILELRDPILKLIFLRFLGHIPEERAVRYVCWLMEDENPVVEEAAERTFERNACDGKTKVLLPLLHSPHPRVQLYVIDKVGQVVWVDALDPLLALLKDCGGESPESTERLLAVLSALRFIPNPKSVDFVMPWIKDLRVEVRFRAVIVLGAIYELGVHRIRTVFHQTLDDSEPHVRQAAVWGLRRRPSQNDLPWLMRMSAADPDAHVRQEAVVGLGVFPIPRVIQHLLELLQRETDRLVSLQCEAILLKMDHDDLVKGLDRILKHSKGPARHRAMLMAAEFQHGSERFYKFLIRGLKNAGNDQERVSYLEALGTLGDVRAAPVLQSYLTESPLVAYVAMAALLKVGGDPVILLNYLEDPQGGHLLKQMILRHLVRREWVPVEHHTRFVQCLQGFLRGDNINMRYLAAQMLIRVAGPLARDELLDAIQHEQDPTSLKLLRDSLVIFFTEQPASYTATLLKKRHDAAAFQVLSAMLADLIWSRHEIMVQLPHLVSPEMVADDESYVACCVEWLAHQIIQGRVNLDEVLKSLTHACSFDGFLNRLVQKLEQVPDLYLPVSADILSQRMAEGDDLERDAMIDLMGISRSQTAIPVLVSVICNDRMHQFHGNAVRALARITQEGVS